MSDFLPAHATFDQRFISRTKWGARKARSITRLSGTRGNTLHWEGPYMGFPWEHAKCYAKVRGIQAFHMDSRKWADIAYSSIECPHGYIFEGRWFGARTAANGTNEGNGASYAHCYLGGERDPLTAEGKMAQRHVIQHFEGRGSGTGVWPHSHWKATQCPGDGARAFVASGEAGRDPRSAPTPPVPAPPPPPEPKVKPMYSPPHDLPPVVASLKALAGGVWLLGIDGSVWAYGGAPYLGAPNGQTYWGGRTAATLESVDDGYAVVASTGERYVYP